MHSHEEEPRCTKYLPKMVLADSVPSHSKETLSKLDKHTKNLSIQTDLISNNNTTKTTKSFDLKRYLNRNSPKYYNLNEKLQTFENSAKNKNFQPFIPAKPLKRNLTPNNVKTEITQKNTQNSTIDQTPKPIENEKNKEEFDYENNFIIAKVNNFFKEKKNNITKPKSEENRLKTPQKIKGWAFDDNKPTEQRKKSERALVKSAERPLKEIKSLKTENDDLDADYNKKPLFLITENRENEDLHNRYQKEIKNLLNKSPIEKNKKNLTKNSLSLSLDKPKLVKTKVEIKEKPKKNIKVTNDKVETKESKAENPQIPTKCEQYEEEEEIKTREKKKTLEKFITQINRGEIFAKPIENSKKTKKNNVRQLEIIEKKANKPKIIRNNIKENKKSTYYFSDLVQAYRVNSIDCDYFTQLYKEHLSQSFQALSYCKNIKPEPKQIEEKKVFLKRRETHKSKIIKFHYSLPLLISISR